MRSMTIERQAARARVRTMTSSEKRRFAFLVARPRPSRPSPRREKKPLLRAAKPYYSNSLGYGSLQLPLCTKHRQDAEICATCLAPASFPIPPFCFPAVFCGDSFKFGSRRLAETHAYCLVPCGQSSRCGKLHF